MIPAALMILILPSSNVYSFILDVGAYPAQFSAIALSSGLLWLRWKRPELARPFKAWRPVILLHIGICIALAAAPFAPSKSASEDYLGLWHGAYAVVGISMYVTHSIFTCPWCVVLGTFRICIYNIVHRILILQQNLWGSNILVRLGQNRY